LSPKQENPWDGPEMLVSFNVKLLEEIKQATPDMPVRKTIPFLTKSAFAMHASKQNRNEFRDHPKAETGTMANAFHRTSRVDEVLAVPSQIFFKLVILPFNKSLNTVR
jgi:hypothetical protein